ncbi:GNAT family N-acetyltransferase [Nocardiopsis sp. CNT312]|uniref:GNAT family N-acetyltransferase n=1 Tax=Nocardiopsis sp. CNT312 TaxID=1137268 RepID=UPI00048CACA4|nr:GNAT family N-acetyltransferase [Nocardiopsis sp. CNT312]
MHEWARRVAEDWPPEETEVTRGWRLGYAGGVTKRANSAVRLEPGASPETVECFYRDRGLPAVVQVWPGMEGLDRELAERGYERGGPSLVMERHLTDAAGPGERFEVLSRPDGRWRALWSAEGASRRVARGQHRIMDRVPVMGYAVESSGAARGCAALSGATVGIYAMFTDPRERGRGLAGGIVGALLAWGQGGGAERAYLLVEEGNAAARRVYERAGFAVVDRYHYRVLAR